MDVVDVAFPLTGERFPLDHGYPLYAAICRLLPHLHEHRDIGIHPIRGDAVGQGQLRLRDRSELRIRVPAARIAMLLPLAGTILDLDGLPVRPGVPRVLMLKPATHLAARMVTIKGFMDADAFRDAARKQLDKLGVSSEAELTLPVSAAGHRSAGQPIRRVMRIRGKTVVGFAVRLAGLSAEESLCVQEQGLGGRRHMGCGLFTPVRTAL